MPRRPGDAAQKLVKAGTALALEGGCGAVTVRAACRRAGVNLGLFHYHFKTRDAFVRRLMNECYSEFFERLSVSAGGTGSAAERLGRALRAIARFSRERRRVMFGLLRDGMNGERQAARFVGENFPRHLPIMLGLYREGVAAGEFRRMPEPLLVSTMMGAMNGPGLLLTLLESFGVERPFGRPRRRLERELLSDAAIETRVEMALAALARPRRRA